MLLDDARRLADAAPARCAWTSLTGSSTPSRWRQGARPVQDAEDLVQEAMLRGLARIWLFGDPAVVERFEAEDQRRATR